MLRHFIWPLTSLTN